MCYFSESTRNVVYENRLLSEIVYKQLDNSTFMHTYIACSKGSRYKQVYICMYGGQVQ